MRINEKQDTFIDMQMRPKIRYWLPAACVQEDDLREELKQLCARGFGGVEIVSLGAQNPEIDRSEDGWGHEKWEHVLDIIADGTEKLGMSMDIANGPGWPIAMPKVDSADHPAALRELTYGCTYVAGGSFFEGPIPERNKVREEGTPRLIALYAYETLGGKTLCRDSFIDLMPYCTDDKLSYQFPVSDHDYIIFSFYEQPAVQKINADQNYVIDHLSKEGAEVCREYWEQQFAKHKFSSMDSIFCDSMEYEVTMDWTPSLPQEFLRRRGYDLLPYLPVVGLENTYPKSEIPGFTFEDPSVSDSINRDYLETITELYCENHLQELQSMASEHGVNIRYQAAYNKPFEEERCGLFVNVPENEALGRPAIDSLKTMAAAVHLGRKERYSYECSAEFGHSYGQNYEDLFWWVKRSLMAGCNSQVLHGASYSGRYNGKYAANGYLPQVQWPGYESFLKAVSNYWNRTLSVEDARGCMDTIARMNTIFRRQARVDCAIFRDSYINDGTENEYEHYPDQGALSNAGFSYEFVSEYLLNLPVCKVTNHILDEEGAAYRSLIIPEINHMSAALANRLCELSDGGLPVVLVGEKPKYPKFYSEYRTESQKHIWNKAIDRLWEKASVLHVKNICDTPTVLKKYGLIPRIDLEGKKQVLTASRVEGQKRYYIIYANNSVEYSPDNPNPDEMLVSAIFKKGTTKGTYERPGIVSREQIAVSLEGNGQVSIYNPWTGEESPAAFVSNTKTGPRMEGTVELEEDEMVILKLDESKRVIPEKVLYEPQRFPQPVHAMFQWKSLTLYSFEPNTSEEKSFLRSSFTEKGYRIPIHELKPWAELDEKLKEFSGKGIYKGTMTVNSLDPEAEYILELGQVDDTFTVLINGHKTKFPDQVMKRVNVTSFLHNGVNEVEVRVVSNLYNKLFAGGISIMGIDLPYRIRPYGMYETKSKIIRLMKYYR